MTPAELQKHIFSTYSHLRIGMITVAFLFPLLLLFGGMLHGIEWQDSMSAYYYAPGIEGINPVMRVWFIGLLYALGTFLFLYKGFSRLESRCLNLAGVFAIGVARFPMIWKYDNGLIEGSYLHYVCAVLMFVCVGIVTLFCTKQTLGLVADADRRRFFRIGYRITGIAMILFPILISLYKWFFPELAEHTRQLFCLEAACIWIFAIYWLLKSWELRGSMAEIEALNQKLTTEPLSGVSSDTDDIPVLLKRFISPVRNIKR